MEALGGEVHVGLVAVHQHDAELVAGVAADGVTFAQLRFDPPRDRGEDLVGDVEAVGLVDGTEIVDTDDDEGDRAAKPLGMRDRVAKGGKEMRTVEIAGELVITRQEGETLVALVALVDDPEHPMGEHRPAALAGVPAPDILDPQPLVGTVAAGVERVLHLIGDTVAAIRAGRIEHGVVPAGQVARIEERGKAATGRDRLERCDLDDVEDVGAPADRVVADRPLVDHFADRGQDIPRPLRDQRIDDGCVHAGAGGFRPVKGAIHEILSDDSLATR